MKKTALQMKSMIVYQQSWLFLSQHITCFVFILTIGQKYVIVLSREKSLKINFTIT